MAGNRATARSKTGQKASQVATAVREREAIVMAAFKRGDNYDSIAAEAGLASRGAVSEIIKRVLARNTVADVEDIRAVELARLDEMFAAIYEAAKAGDLPSQEGALKIMRERRKYLPGLETPQQHQIALDQQVQSLVLQLEAQLGVESEADG